MRNLSLPVATLLLSTLCACGSADSGSNEALGRQSSAVQGGKTDTSSSHNFAVGLASKYGAVCTGTLIAPNLVLTARHCVVPPEGESAVTCADKFPANIRAKDLLVTTDPNIYRTRDYIPAKEIITPEDDGFCGNDIALVILSESISESEATPATPVVQFSMTDRSKIGGKVVAMGYGITSPTANDSGQRRIREDIEILCIPGDEDRKCDGRTAGLMDSDREFITEGWVCSGDSGGGAFEQTSFDEGKPYVLGALSRGPQTDETCLAAIYSRTDAHADMIIEAGKKAAAEGGYDEPEWVKPLGVDPAGDPTDEGCVGDTCTDTSETEPGTGGKTIVRTTTTGCAASGVPVRSSGEAFAFAVAAFALLAGRRRRS